MTADQAGRIEAVSPDSKLIAHGCLIEPGDSGGPLLSRDTSEEVRMLGVNVVARAVTSDRAAPRNQDFWGGYAASAAGVAAY
jgi:hypothetical protein